MGGDPQKALYNYLKINLLIAEPLPPRNAKQTNGAAEMRRFCVVAELLKACFRAVLWLRKKRRSLDIVCFARGG